MKRLTTLCLLCAMLLTGCVFLRPKDHMLDGDGMEKPKPDTAPIMQMPEPVPTDEELEALRPRLILDGCEPGEANGLTLRVTGYQDGELTVEYSNTAGEVRAYYESFTLSKKEDGAWAALPWPEDKVWPDSEFLLEPDGQAKLTLDVSDLGALDAGEYLLTTSGVETSFWLVYTE